MAGLTPMTFVSGNRHSEGDLLVAFQNALQRLYRIDSNPSSPFSFQRSSVCHLEDLRCAYWRGSYRSPCELGVWVEAEAHLMPCRRRDCLGRDRHSDHWKTADPYS